MDADIERAIATIPALAGYDGEIERLGGLTNLVYRLGNYCLRLPGAGTAEYINRAHEAETARRAAEARVGPEVIFADPQTGVMVTCYIDGAVTMTPALFASRTGAPARAGAAFAQLHTSGVAFPFTFELFSMIDDYLRILATKDIALPEGYTQVVAEAETLRTALKAGAVAPVPCHCDPLCENLLDTGDRMWIVDWEYSGMNDPMWDLGDLSVEGGFSEAQDDEMLRAYFGGAAPAADRGRMVIYKAMCDLLWTLWGLIQLANDNPAEDFRAYAEGRFARCRALMADPAFSHHVKAVSA